jgi:hypothetical protein
MVARGIPVLRPGARFIHPNSSAPRARPDAEGCRILGRAARADLPRQDSEQLRSAPRTLLAPGGTLPDSPQSFRAERRENMVADRAYSPGLFASTDPRASLFYFAAAVPTVGFVHGAADLNPLHAAALESYAEGRFIKRAARIDTVACRKPSTASRHSSSARLWPLQWLA